MNPQINNDLIAAVFEVEEESTEESTQVITDPTDPNESIDSTEPPAGDETDSSTGASTEASTEVTTDTELSPEPSSEATEPDVSASTEGES